MARFDGSVVVVTGGGRGIGRACALGFAREGANVVVSSRTEADLAALVAEIEAAGGTALAVVADATKRASARAPVEAALARFGRIDVLVNNVGGCVGSHDAFTENEDSFEQTLLLNLHSAWWACSAALPAMREAGFGRVITIGSTESLHANAGAPAAYIAGKHAVAGLTRQLASDCGKSGITVNCVCPGWTETTMVDFAAMAPHFGGTEAAARAYAAGQCAQDQVMQPAEVAETVLFLASAEAARITGQIISVDGGYRL